MEQAWGGAGLPRREAEPQGRAVVSRVSPGQALTIFQRSLTTMQSQVAGLLQFAVPVFPTAEVRRLPPAASVLGAGTPPLDFDSPPAARTSPSSAPGLHGAGLRRALPGPFAHPAACGFRH